MRIVRGSVGGRVLRAPPGSDTRPTSEKVREAIFNILPDVEGMQVLDLFAGSGALGLEALSRGAAHATFVDQGKAALTAVRGKPCSRAMRSSTLRGMCRHRHGDSCSSTLRTVLTSPSEARPRSPTSRTTR
jgi:16S rRNA G966 N2-methylase RsmD